MIHAIESSEMTITFSSIALKITHSEPNEVVEQWSNDLVLNITKLKIL